MKAISIIVIIGSFALFQVHSAFAWIEITGNLNGILWAIMFEVSAFYFIYTKHDNLGIATYIIVLLMASFNISKDTRIKLETSVNDKTLEVLVSTLDNIKDKDYPITIQKTMKAITDLKTDEAMKQDTKIEYSLWLGIALQIIALSLILVAQIKAIMFIRQNTTVTPQKQDVTSVTTTRNELIGTSKRDLAKEVLDMLIEYGREKGFDSERKITYSLQLALPTFQRLRQTIETDNGMSVDKMNEIKEMLK